MMVTEYRAVVSGEDRLDTTLFPRPTLLVGFSHFLWLDLVWGAIVALRKEKPSELRSVFCRGQLDDTQVEGHRAFNGTGGSRGGIQ